MNVRAKSSIEEFLEPSDEEVLAVSEDVSESEDDYEDAEETPEPSAKRARLAKVPKLAQDTDSETSAAPEDDEDAGGWGTSRSDYYNADAIETEADALEEELEARRLQQKQLQGMTEADFGFDASEWLEDGKSDEDGDDDEGRGRVLREILPRLEITDAMGPEERSKLLRTRYPEFEPLVREFLDLRSMYEDLRSAAMEAESVQNYKLRRTDGTRNSDDRVPSMTFVKYSALSSYLAALSIYFALLTSGQEGADGKRAIMPPEDLRDHGIMETLVQCRDLWHKANNVVVPETNGMGQGDAEIMNGFHDHDITINGKMDGDGEIEDKPKKRKIRKSKVQKALERAQIEAEAQRAERLRKTEEELASITSITERAKPPSKPIISAASIVKAHVDPDSDFGEQTSLTAHEAAEKAKRKKSLRFYTSQIAQKSNKRGAAGRDAGGDADLPYRERLKDRQTRLNAEAESRGKKPKQNIKEDALGVPSDEEDHAAARELRDDGGSGSEDYYDLVASRAADKKAAKAALAAAHAQAEKEGGIVRIVDDEKVGKDGKRAISYQIEKNKVCLFLSRRLFVVLCTALSCRSISVPFA